MKSKTLPFGAFGSGNEIPGGRILISTPSFSVPGQLDVASLTVFQNRFNCINKQEMLTLKKCSTKIVNK